MALIPTVNIKRGDDLRLDVTITDVNNASAVSAASTLASAQATLDAANAAVPQVPTDITNAQTALTAAQAVYDAAIIVDISGWTIECAMGWRGNNVATFVVTITDAVNGKFSITTTSAVTKLWTPRVYEADIEFNRPGQGISSSETFNINVIQDITNG